jgi:hypothetical protein
MAFTQTRLSGPATLSNIASMNTVPGSASYTVGVGKTTIVKQIMFSNLTSSTQQVSTWVVPPLAAAGDSHMIFHSLDLAAYETMLINLSLVMVAGDSVWVGAGTASSVNFTMSGIEES